MSSKRSAVYSLIAPTGSMRLSGWVEKYKAVEAGKAWWSSPAKVVDPFGTGVDIVELWCGEERTLF